MGLYCNKCLARVVARGGRGHRLARSVDDPRGLERADSEVLARCTGAEAPSCGRHSVLLLLSVECEMSDPCCGSVLGDTMSIE